MTHDASLLSFPVSCPICRKEVLAEYRRADVLGALVNDRPMRLYAPCCNSSWMAGYIEVQQIRAHLGVARLDSPIRTLSAHHREIADD